MSSSLTPELELFKPVPDTAEPFRSSDFNSNMDKIDAAFTVEELLPRVQDAFDEGVVVDGGTP